MTDRAREVARTSAPADAAGPDAAATAGAVGGPAGGALRLHDAGARHGAFGWTEQRLFALTGAWAAVPGPADDARLSLFEWSAQHAWHAQLWVDRLPVLAGVDREGLVRPPSDALETALEVLAPPASADGAVGGVRAGGFLAALSKVVLPGLLDAYRAHGRRLVPVADRPAARALTLVVRDETDELTALEALAAVAVATADAAGDADATVSRLEAILGPRGGSGACFSCSED